MINELKSTIPDTPAKAAVIARAKQAASFKWIPKRDVPTYTRVIGNTVLPEGKVVVGFPYSSTERTDKFIAENISIETLISAISNPNSIIYSVGQGAFEACSYGMVCNGLVRYALGIDRRVSTRRWYTIPGMRRVAEAQKYTVDDIELCDMLFVYSPSRSHVAIITDILRDENGKIAKIEVSEAIRPSCVSRLFTPEEFYDKYIFFELCRYDYIESVPLLDNDIDAFLKNREIDVPIPKICVDNGNKSNYLAGETVQISVFGDDNDVVELYCNYTLVEEIKVGARAIISRKLNKGYYEAKLKAANESVYFCVNKAKIDFSVDNGVLSVRADPCDPKSEIHYMDFRMEGEGCASLSKYEDLTDEEKASGVFSRNIPDDGYNFKVYFKNPYGVWVHPMKKIK